MTGFSADLDAEDPSVLRLSGELDIAAVNDFLDRARVALGAADPVLRIDVSEVTFVDSTGLGALVRLREHAQSKGKQVEMEHIPRQMSRILDLTGLAGLFDGRPES